jgi:hypothetical protein
VPLAEWVIPYFSEATRLRTESVAIASLFDYSVAQYGYDRVPLLLANLSQYKEWKTLAPVAFGVSTGEFETGWHTYRADQRSEKVVR